MSTTRIDPEVTSPAAPAAAEGVAAPLPVGTRLGDHLVGAGLITQEELEAGLLRQSKTQTRLGETLVDLGFVEEEEILPFIQRQIGMPVVRLRDGIVDPQVVRVVPRHIAEQFSVLAMFRVRGTLTLAMAEPQNLEQIDEIERITGLQVRAVFAVRSVIERMIRRVYEEGFEVDAVTADISEDAVELEAVDISTSTVDGLVDGSPVINLVNYLIVQAIRQGASDIHIEPSRVHSFVRFRVDGLLREVLRPRRDLHPAVVSRVKVMAKMDIAEHRLPQDGRLHVIVEGREIDLRVSTMPTVLGEKVVLRVLDKNRVNFNLDLLGLPADMIKPLKQMLTRPYGLLLVTGPTGSGKTTTLYSAIELIKSVHRNIVTVEDPVEYQLELINQVQVDSAAQLSFSGALRSILRQDPDVIMVGEIRDNETAKVAVQAALTGHLVLSTLHTNDAAGAVTRLVDMSVETFKLSAALIGVVAQRLVRTICPHCITKYYPRAEILQSINYRGDYRRTFARGEGCQKCHDTGFQGRIGIYEVLTTGPELRELIAAGATVDVIRQYHRKTGGRSLFQQGVEMAEKEITSLDEVIRVAFAD
ncbi:MAG: GspE/PulE family protein [Pirellulaceae bacterium]